MTKSLKYGLMWTNTGPFVSGIGATVLAHAAEGAGFESLWAVEHVVVPAGYETPYPYDASGKMPWADNADIPDPFVWLTWVAACTTTIRLATGVVILPQRDPFTTAKAVATLDAMSGGRMMLGVGVGWLREEYDALGVSFGDRGRRMDDHIEALRALWRDDPASFEGPFTSFTNVISRPAPHHGTVPIVVGGHSEAAARRAGRLGDGFFPGVATDAEITNLLGIMRAAADEAGRDASAIEVSVVSLAALDPNADSRAEGLARLRDLGVHRALVPPLSTELAATEDSLAEFGANVIDAH